MTFHPDAFSFSLSQPTFSTAPVDVDRFADDPKPLPAKARKTRRATRGNEIKRAKVLTKEQLHDVLNQVRGSTAYDKRQEVMVRLGFEAGLRACEIAGLQWSKHILDAGGQIGRVIRITNEISKRAVERDVPISAGLRQALTELRQLRGSDRMVIYPLIPKKAAGAKRKLKDYIEPGSVSKNLNRYYERIGLDGATSHSGRRTFITTAVRKANTDPEFSLHDAQLMIGHKKLDTTAGYIEPNPEFGSVVSSLYD